MWKIEDRLDEGWRKEDAAMGRTVKSCFMYRQLQWTSYRFVPPALAALSVWKEDSSELTESTTAHGVHKATWA